MNIPRSNQGPVPQPVDFKTLTPRQHEVLWRVLILGNADFHSNEFTRSARSLVERNLLSEPIKGRFTLSPQALEWAQWAQEYQSPSDRKCTVCGRPLRGSTGRGRRPEVHVECSVFQNRLALAMEALESIHWNPDTPGMMESVRASLFLGVNQATNPLTAKYSTDHKSAWEKHR